MHRTARLTLATALVLALGLAPALPLAAAENDPPERRLSAKELNGLMVALDREYRLQAVYDLAVAEYGARQPFLTARSIQRARVDALQKIYRRHDLAVPRNPWLERLQGFSSPAQACVAAYRGELEIEGLLDRLDEATERADLSSAYGSSREPGTWRNALRDCALDASVEEAVAAGR
ncbi:MAG TPA: hypothetical protein VHQ65_10370 [Thermoanaerobaculia bacterium]|nr:hypothetical protein [Thermoanaerobaculia bacterium]